MAKSLPHQDASQTASSFVAELLEDGSRSALACEWKIDAIDKIRTNPNEVQQDIEHPHDTIVTWTFFPMEGKKHEQDDGNV